MRRSMLVALVALSAGGCYHAVVSTATPAGTAQFRDRWAESFVFGLVPPDPVNAIAACGNQGTASVESRISFLNGLVSLLTLSIFTPMEITVTCRPGQEEQVVTAPTHGFPGSGMDRIPR